MLPGQNALGDTEVQPYANPVKLRKASSRTGQVSRKLHVSPRHIERTHFHIMCKLSVWHQVFHLKVKCSPGHSECGHLPNVVREQLHSSGMPATSVH